MRYSPFNEEEISRLYNGLYAGGHTDSSAITLLFRQVVAGLQIKDPQSGQWKYVKPMTNSVTVNAGDCLSFLTGNYIKSTIHRVCLSASASHRVQLNAFIGQSTAQGPTYA